MDDDTFLRYCEVHADTPRCGFVPQTLARLCRLAGREQWALFWDDQPNQVIDCEPAAIKRAVADAFARQEVRPS